MSAQFPVVAVAVAVVAIVLAAKYLKPSNAKKVKEVVPAVPSAKFQKERQTAIEAVRLACQVCQTVQSELVAQKLAKTEEKLSKTKEDKSPVTVADFAAQAVVNSTLLKAFPDCKVVGEEDAQDLREGGKAEALCPAVVKHAQGAFPSLTSEDVLKAIDHGLYEGGSVGRHWALDPIDGTKGFLRCEQYAVALGLIENGEVVLGVLGCPNLPVNWAEADNKDAPRGVIFIGVKGEPAYSISLAPGSSEKQIAVSDLSDPKQAFYVESVEAGHTDQGHSAAIGALLGMDMKQAVRMDSQAKYAALARGDAPVYLRLPTIVGYQEKIWDHAAGVAVIESAGGKVTDVNGKPLDFSLGRTLKNNSGVIATNGKFHDEVVKAVQSVLNQKDKL